MDDVCYICKNEVKCGPCAAYGHRHATKMCMEQPERMYPRGTVITHPNFGVAHVCSTICEYESGLIYVQLLRNRGTCGRNTRDWCEYQCIKCGKTDGAKRCGGCGVVWYCGKTCQTQDWRRHRPSCKQNRAPVLVPSIPLDQELLDAQAEQVGRHVEDIPSVFIREEDKSDTDDEALRVPHHDEIRAALDAYTTYVRKTPNCLSKTQHAHLIDLVKLMSVRNPPDWFAAKKHHSMINGRSGNDKLWDHYVRLSMEKRCELNMDAVIGAMRRGQLK